MSVNGNKKRPHDGDNTGDKSLSHEQQRQDKRAKSRHVWRRQAQDARNNTTATTISPGDQGIWATCNKGKEGKTVIDLRDLFEEYAERLYGSACHGDETSNAKVTTTTEDNNDEGGEEDIEASISAELAGLQNPRATTSTRRNGDDTASTPPSPSFVAVKLATPCLLFFKTRPPVVPVDFVQRICRDWADPALRRGIRGCRYVQRLTPATLVGRAHDSGLYEVANSVLPPVYHVAASKDKTSPTAAATATTAQTTTQEADALTADANGDTDIAKQPGSSPFCSYSIRPTIRNNNQMKRDDVIHSIARIIGSSHTVDLKTPETAVLVDIYQNLLSMCVITQAREYDGLKRFNLAELVKQQQSAGN